MMNLNWKQRRIVEALVSFQQEGRKKFLLKELVPFVYPELDRAPKNPLVAIAAGIRNFGFKLSGEKGFRLKRSSPLGRGHAGEYEFSGNFEALLEGKTDGKE